ncbi:MAG: hypothetical protein FWE76_04530 [Symbiobacteriaceae bacterium]|jgi:hypothetical protein|nr:hypothetical protein [Symbiobacteriaceae bacterium]
MPENAKHAKIEEAIIELLEGETRENALALAAYLSEERLTPNVAAWGKIAHNGFNLGSMRVEGQNNWVFEVFNYLDFGRFSDDDEEFVRVVHDHVSICEAPCHDECWRAKDAKVFGREFKSICSQHGREFINPDAAMIAHIIKLIGYSKQTTPYPQQYHPNNPKPE